MRSLGSCLLASLAFADSEVVSIVLGTGHQEETTGRSDRCRCSSYEAIGGSIDRLNRLGVSIRQYSASSLASRIRAFGQKKEYTSLETLSLLSIKYLYPRGTASLQDLLSKTMVARCIRLLYMREHQSKLEKRRHPQEVFIPTSENLISGPGTVDKNLVVANSSHPTPSVREDATTDLLEPVDAQNKTATDPSTLNANSFHKKFEKKEIKRSML